MSRIGWVEYRDCNYCVVCINCVALSSLRTDFVFGTTRSDTHPAEAGLGVSGGGERGREWLPMRASGASEAGREWPAEAGSGRQLDRPRRCGVIGVATFH